MQLNSTNLKALVGALFFLAIASIGCQSSPNHATKEISDLSGYWESSSAIDSKSKENHDVAINISKDGSGEFKYFEGSGKMHKFKFELLVGVNKVALFVDDGSQFVYEYILDGDELRLENAADGSLILLNRK